MAYLGPGIAPRFFAIIAANCVIGELIVTTNGKCQIDKHLNKTKVLINNSLYKNTLSLIIKFYNLNSPADSKQRYANHRWTHKFCRRPSLATDWAAKSIRKRENHRTSRSRNLNLRHESRNYQTSPSFDRQHHRAKRVHSSHCPRASATRDFPLTTPLLSMHSPQPEDLT